MKQVRRLLGVLNAAIFIAMYSHSITAIAQNDLSPPPGAGFGRSAPATVTYSGAVATEWFQLALQIAQQTPGFSPPVTARALGYMGLALYESVVPGMPGHASLAGQLNELSSLPWAQPDEPLHWPTVANAALAKPMPLPMRTSIGATKRFW